jgi:hypothetical protein
MIEKLVIYFQLLIAIKPFTQMLIFSALCWQWKATKTASGAGW